MMKRFAVACLSVALYSGSPAFAADTKGTESSAKSEVVFLTYTQAELDRNYDQGKWATNIKQILQRYGARSDLTRQRLGSPETVAYGEDKVETFDLFRAKGDKAPLHVFIHGGAWRAGKANGYHFPAEMFVDKGVSYAALDFGNVQDIGLDGMTAQLRKAIARSP